MWAWTPSVSADYLYHHGIKGQRWGVRNGPPYPLGSGGHSASERKAGWRKSLSSDTDSRKSGSALRSMEAEDIKIRKKYGVIGDSGTSKSTVTHDAKSVASSCGFQLKTSPLSVGEDIKATNPGWFERQNDLRWANNCTHSVVAFAARRRGLDINATPMTKKQGEQGGESLLTTCNRYFKGGFQESDFNAVKLRGVGGVISSMAIGIDVTSSGPKYERKASKELGKTYQNAPNGAYGMVQMSTIFGGHVFVWYKEDGTVKFADSQTGLNAGFDFERISRYGAPKALLHIRLDDRELDERHINEAIAPAHTMRHSAIMPDIHWGKELYHYGIKGMKWGVRRSPEQLGHKTAKKTTAKSRLRQFGEAVDKTYRTARKVMATAVTVASVVTLAKVGMEYAKQNPAVWSIPASSPRQASRGKAYVNSGKNWKKYRNFQNRVDPMLDFRQTL